MCLIKAKPVKTEKDITCYKVCYRTYGGTYVSPFMWYNYIPGQLYQVNTNNPQLGIVDKDGLYIEGNAFHTFKTLQGARQYLKNKYTDYEYVIMKCIIPKESEYIYEGIFKIYFWNKFRKFVSYASQQILPVSVIEWSGVK